MKGREKKGEFMFPVECHECGEVFDFANYIESMTDLKDKHIAELVLEKCDGDTILCQKCMKLGRKVIEKGNFEWVAKGPGGLRVADLELTSDDGKKRIMRFVEENDKGIT